jgi:hypothetical protein
VATLGIGMDRIVISVPADASFQVLLRLVVGGICSRSQLSYEQVNECQLAVEALVAHRDAASDVIQLEATIDDERLALLVGPFVHGDHPGGRRVLDRLVERVEVVDRDGQDWISLEATGGAVGRTGP